MNFDQRTMGRLTALQRDIARKFRQVGLLHTLKHGAIKLIKRLGSDTTEIDPFDNKYGTDTARIISVGALDISDEKLKHSNRYEAVVPEAFYAIMQTLPISHDNYAFIDVGSGKGRALLLASFLPFKEIIGVEISAALTDIAASNVRIFNDKQQKCRNIKLVCIDGSLYTPPDEPIVLYLNNPFDDKPMRSLAANVNKSLLMSPRKIFIVYQRPLHKNIWDENDNFQLIHKAQRYVIYESK